MSPSDTSQPSSPDAGTTESTAEPHLVYETLREAGAAAGKLIGVALNESALASDATYRELAAQQFDYVTPENATKWGPLQPSAGSYDWADADAILDFAESAGQAVKGHTFAWYMQNPSWVTSSMSAEELETALRTHIRTTLERYRGRIRAWDVVNEAVDTDTSSGYRENIFWEKLGPEYIENAFHWAREADPDALLYYNEIAAERLGPKSDFAYQMIKDLLERGVPIDGFGFQSHLSTHRYPSEADLRANLKRFADLGLRVNISELDVRDTLLPGSDESRAIAQRIAYQQVVGACALEPGCEAITFWGFTDAYSWLLEEGDFKPLLFDRNYEPKPAYRGVMDGLLGLLPARGANLLRNADFSAGDAEWSASGGSLSVTQAADRSGNLACVSGRSAPEDGLVQDSLLDILPTDGPLAFRAWVRASANSTVDASLLIAEAGREPREFNVASTQVDAAEWRELSGYLGVGYEGTPLSLALKLHGPAESVELCAMDVQLQPLEIGE